MDDLVARLDLAWRVVLPGLAAGAGAGLGWIAGGPLGAMLGGGLGGGLGSWGAIVTGAR